MRQAATTGPATKRFYLERVNLAIDYMIARLDRPLRLRGVAQAAGLSPHHFHRVFQGITGESPAEFVRRQRLDWALAQIAQSPGATAAGERGRTAGAGRVRTARGTRPPIADIAARCGFASLSDFSRSFRRRFGAAPSRFDLAAWQAQHRAALDAIMPPTPPTAERARLRALPAVPGADRFHARVRALPARSVAYIRVRNPYAGSGVIDAASRLIAWAERHGLAGGAWLGFQWENPEITPLERCRYHVGVQAEGFTPRGEVGRYRFPPMLVAEVELLGDIHDELAALRWLYGHWLPRSGYVPAHHPCFEAWVGRPFALGHEKFHLHVQLPVKPRGRGG